MGREILGEMVAIESTEAMGLATDVSEYAAAVLLDNGFKSMIFKLLAQLKKPRVYMQSIVDSSAEACYCHGSY